MAMDESTRDRLRKLLQSYVDDNTYSFQDFDHLEATTVGRERWTVLHMATTRDAIEDVKLLIAGGVDVNAQSDIGMTPLHSAIMGNNLELMRILLDAGASPELKDVYGDDSFEIAAKYENNQAMLALLRDYAKKQG